MNIEQLIDFAIAYNRLGWAIQAQVNDIVNGDYDDLNLNAVKEINQKLRGFHDDLDSAIDEALRTAQ